MNSFKKKLILVGLILVFSGCGSKPPERRPRPSQVDDPPPAVEPASEETSQPPAEETPQPPPPTGSTNPEDPNSDPDRPVAAEPASAKPMAVKPVRPNDLTAWQPDDFRTALADRDPRLGEAARTFARVKADDEETARLLVELLAIPADQAGTAAQANSDDEVDTYAPRGGPLAPDTAKAIVAGLAINGSPVAETALKDMLRGRFRSLVDDRTLVSAVVEALVQNFRPSYEGPLLALLKIPEQIRPEGQEPRQVKAAELQSICLQSVEPVASSAFRKSLAQHLLARSTPASHAAVLEPFLLKPDILNLEAQIVLLGRNAGGDANPRLREPIEAFIADTIDWFMEVPLQPDNGRRIANGLRPDTAPLAAKALWGSDLSRLLSLPLAAPDSRPEGDQAHLIEIMATLPTPAARSQLFAAFDRNSVHFSQVVQKTTEGVKSWRDPGLLLVLKSLPREQPPLDERGGYKRPSRTLTGSKAAAVERAKKEREARQDWFGATEKLIAAFNDRFYTAGLQQARRARRAPPPGSSRSESGDDPFDSVRVPGEASARDSVSDEAADDEESSAEESFFPFAQLDELEPRTSYSLDWPEGLRGQLGTVEVGHLKVRYARFEKSDRMTRVFNYYHRQLKSPEEYNTKRGRWLDSIYRDPDSGLMQSVDVLVYRTIDEAPASRDTVEDLIIEILLVEAPDPSGKTIKTAGNTR
ncbi:MAG: hypothetical protein AB7O62_05100 [Pirellulales bacterium]